MYNVHVYLTFFKVERRFLLFSLRYVCYFILVKSFAFNTQHTILIEYNYENGLNMVQISSHKLILNSTNN